MRNKILIPILVLTFSFFAFTANAQVQGTDVVLSINPQYPSPGQSVKASVGTSAFNLDGSDISWFVNGAKAFEGIGKKEFSFNAGAIGSQMTVEVRISAPDGSLIDKAIIINPAGIDLLWEAYDSYTPPFYRGKAMVPEEGMFKVVAMPNLEVGGQKISSGNLAYTWRQDDNSQQDASGYGKNYFIFRNSYLDSNNKVAVSVSDIRGRATGTESITLSTRAPKIVFYEKDPVFGVRYENALRNGVEIGIKPIIIEAVPYFFSASQVESSDLKYSWAINGQPVEITGKKNELAIKVKQAGGNGKIDLSIEHLSKLFQSVTGSLGVSF